MNKNYNDETFCVAPWLSSHISTWNDVMPCCIYKGNSFGKTQEGKDFIEHYNSSEAVNIRKKLWNGDKVKGCSECWFREKSDKTYRTNLNEIFGDYIDELIDNTNEDFTLKEPKFRMLDLRFDNKCNLRCRMCHPRFSSALYKEYVDLKYDLFEAADWDSPYHVAVDDKEYQFILDQLKYTKILFFAGGEPLTQDKFYEILQYCIDSGIAKDIKLWITSNCTKVKYKKYDLVKMLNQFKGVEITASIDGFGDRGEYLRYPSKWSDVEDNIKTITSQVNNLLFMIVPTIQILNVFHILPLIKYMSTKGYITPNNVHVNILDFPNHLNAKNLPDDYKSSLYDDCVKFIEWLNEAYPDTNMDQAINQVNLLREVVSRDIDKSQWPKFLNYTESVDKYRGNDFYKTFPELAELKYIFSE